MSRSAPSGCLCRSRPFRVCPRTYGVLNGLTGWYGVLQVGFFATWRTPHQPAHSGHRRRITACTQYQGLRFWLNNQQEPAALLYFIHMMDHIAAKEYVVVYFHTLTGEHNHLDSDFLKNMYDIVDAK
ncbi:hypothetical protein FKM82_027332 [Ascaphus truei]